MRQIRFLAVLLVVVNMLAGCGAGGSGSTASTSANGSSLPAAQSVVAAPTAVTQPVTLSGNDTVFSATTANPDGLPVMKTALKFIPKSFTGPKATTNETTPTGYTPTELRQAYGTNTYATTGSGQTIAIVDAYGSPTIQSDLATFCSTTGLPTANLTIAYENGSPTSADAGWGLETTLDVEWAHAIAPGAQILLVVAQSANTSDLLASVQYATSHGANVVSMSWGSSEWSGETQYDSYFDVSGVAFTASAGDSGAGAEWPAASPFVTGIGGTTLSLNSSGDILSETGWSDSGGGPSAYETVPTFQSDNASAHAVVGSVRGVPDVSYDADPNTGVMVYDSTPYEGYSGWEQLGGTSIGAPQWAALLAMANSLHAVTSPNTALYKLSESTFRDITSGNNGYPCQAGWDFVTGLGSPAQNVITGVATGEVPSPTPTPSPSPSPKASPSPSPKASPSPSPKASPSPSPEPSPSPKPSPSPSPKPSPSPTPVATPTPETTGVVSTQPWATTTLGGVLYGVYVASGGEVKLIQQAANGITWSTTLTLSGATTAQAVTMAAWDSSLLVAITSTSGEVLVGRITPGATSAETSWTGWTYVGYSSNFGPTLASDGTHAYLLFTSTYGQVLYSEDAPKFNSNSYWVSTMQDSVNRPGATVGANATLYIARLGSGSTAEHIFYKGPSGWTDTGQLSLNAPAMVYDGGYVYIGYRSSSNYENYLGRVDLANYAPLTEKIEASPSLSVGLHGIVDAYLNDTGEVHLQVVP